VIVTKATGVRSCRSNLVTCNGRLAVADSTSGAWLGIPRPNPTRGLVATSLCLPAAGVASLEVYDVAGRRVARLLSGHRNPGVHVALWDARGAAAGIYLITARRGGWSATRRVLVMR
jgi:hypothetical protein